MATKVRTAPMGEAVANAPSAPFQSATGGEFGQTQAAQFKEVGGLLDRAGTSFGNVALAMQSDLNETRVQELNNEFIAAQQKTLFTDKDAFYRQKGANAIEGAEAATNKLLDLKKDILARENVNPTIRKRLGEVLDRHFNSATDGISRHVASQSMEWEKQVAAGRQKLLLNEASRNPDDFKLHGDLATAAATTALEQARQQGHLPDSPFAKAQAQAARSNIWTTVISQQLDGNNPRRALAIHSKVKGQLDQADNDKITTRLKAAATDVESDDVITRRTTGLPQSVKQYVPDVQKAAAAENVPVELAVGVLTQESGGNPGAVGPPTRFGTAKGLMQLIDGTAKDLGVTDPHDPKQAIPGGVKYLGQMLTKYNGDQTLALMGYNWGPGNVDNWIKAGKDPSKIPAETRDYLTKVRGYANAYTGVGFEKADSKSLVLSIMADDSIPPAVRTAAAAKIEKRSAALESARTSQLKGLDDQFEATTQAMIMQPSSYKAGMLAEIAEGYRQAGDMSKYVNATAVAANEAFLLNFLTSGDSAQKKIVAAMLSGKAKAFADGILAADSKTSADSGKLAREELSGLKTAAAANVDMTTLQGKATKALDLAVKAGDSVLARDIHDTYNSHVASQAAGRAPPLEQQRVLDEMKKRVETLDQSNGAIETLRVTQEAKAKQDAAFKQDAFLAGTSTYPDVGLAAPISDLRARVEQANKVSAHRGGAPVIPFTVPEIDTMRRQLEGGDPVSAAKMFQTLSAAIPPAMIPHVAAALSGKNEGDNLSRSYAAAFSFYADSDPTSRAIGDKILYGAKTIKEMGEAGKAAPTTGEAWQQALQTRMGGVFRDVSAKVPASIASAVEAVYVGELRRLGKQGEKLEADVLDRSIKTVLGETVSVNGSMILPPKRGMTVDEVDRGFRFLAQSPGMMAGWKTTEGDDVNGDVVYRRGILSNAGRDGMYFLRIPDPRAGDDPRPVVGADGKPVLIDLRAMTALSSVMPPEYAPGDALGRDRVRRLNQAPKSPTDGLDPVGR